MGVGGGGGGDWCAFMKREREREGWSQIPVYRVLRLKMTGKYECT